MAIQELRQERGWSLEELARRVGMSRAAVGKREAGQQVKIGEYKKWADAFEIAISEFRDVCRRHATIDRPVYKADRIPIINHTPAGPTMDYVAWSQAGDEGYAYIPRGDIDDELAFAVTVVGASMEPTLRQGDVVVLSPIQPQRDKDLHDFLEQIFFVRVSEDSKSPGVFLGRLVAIENEELLVFTKDNPRHAGVRVPCEHVERMARLIELRRKGPL